MPEELALVGSFSKPGVTMNPGDFLKLMEKVVVECENMLNNLTRGRRSFIRTCGTYRVSIEIEKRYNQYSMKIEGKNGNATLFYQEIEDAHTFPQKIKLFLKEWGF